MPKLSMRSGSSGSDVSVVEPVPSVVRIVLGHLSFNVASRASMAELIEEWLARPGQGGKSIAFVNPHVFNVSAELPHVEHWLASCDFVCVDGIGIKLALRCLRRGHVERVVAEELFREVLLKPGIRARALLVGVHGEEVKQAAAAITQAQPAVSIVDCIDGFSSDQEYTSFFTSHPDIDLVLIGAGTPSSERIGAIAETCCGNAVCWHIGAGTIKTWAGTKRRAPAWISRAGIQWLHRMLFEPHTRTRYVAGSLKFAFNLFRAPKH